MSGPTTVTVPQRKAKETKDTGASQQPITPPAVCCERIRETAYYKWEAAGCPCGDGVDFWLQAEAEVIAGPQSDAFAKSDNIDAQ